jgi:hypothetical protein
MNTDNGALEFDAYINNQRLFTSAAEAERRIKGISNTAIQEGDKMESALSKIGPLVAGYFGFEALKGFSTELVRVRGEFQKYEAVLTNTFGSNDKAVKSMAMLTDIASKTPFQLDAITDSYIKLVNQGFEPTRDQIISLGDLASSTGKGFDQLVEGILDAQNGEFERMKEFGIKASVNGDKVIMSFKGVSTEIDKSSESIRNYILGLGKMQGVAGSMEAISGTLVGQISNLQDAWAQMMNKIGSQNEGLISDIVSVSSTAVVHYKEIGEALMVIAVSYGAYKAAVVATSMAVNGSYEIENTQLEKLISIEQLHNIEKQKLTATAVEYNATIRGEIASNIANMESQKAILVIQEQAVKAQYKYALQQALDSKALVSQREMELSLAKLSGEASQLELAQKSLLEAQEQRHIAVKARKAVADEYAIAQSKIKSTSTAIETLTGNANAVSTSTQTVLTRVLTTAKTQLTAVTQKLNAAIMENPLAIFAAAIAVAAYGIYKFATYSTQAEKAQKELDAAIEGETLTLEIMFDRLKNAKQGTQEYADAKQAIIDKYGQYDATLTSELETIDGLKLAYDKLTEAVINSAKVRLREKYTKEAADESAEDISNYYSEIRDRIQAKLGKDAGSALFSSVKGAFENGEDWKKLLENQGISTEDVVMTGPSGTTMAKNEYVTLFEKIARQKLELKNTLSEFDDIFGDAKRKNEDGTKAVTDPLLSLADQIEVAKKAVEKANADYKTELEKTYSEKDVSKHADSIKKAKEAIKKAEDELALLENKDKNSGKKDQKDADIDLSMINKKAKQDLELRQHEIDNQKALLDLTQDGFAKERAMIDINHKQKLLDIDKQALELLEKQQEAEKMQWEKDGKKGVFTPGTILTDSNQKVITDMTNVSDKQYISQIADLIKRLGELYMSFDQKRREIDNRYNEDSKALSASFTGAELKTKLDVLNAQKKAELTDLSKEEAELVERDNKLLVNLFDRVGKMSKKTTLETLQSAQKLLSYLRGESGFNLTFISKEDADKLKQSPDDINKIQESVDNLKQTLEPDRKQYLFSGFVDGIKDMKSAQELLKKAASATTDEMKESYQAQAELMQKNAMQNIAQGAYDALGGIQALTDAMMALADASGDERMKEKAEMFQAMGSNLQAAGEGAKSGGWIGAIVGGVVNIVKQTVEAKKVLKAEEKEAEQNSLDFLNEYNLLLLKVNENQDRVFNSDNTANIIDAWAKAQDALQQYNDAVNKTTNPTKTEEYSNAGAMVFTGTQWVSKTNWGKELSNEYKKQLEAYNKGYTDLQGMAVKTKDYSGWQNFWGKQDQYTSLKDLAPKLWDSSGQFDTEAAKTFLDTNTQITDEQRKQIQNVIDLKESYDSAMEAIDAEIKDTFGGLYDSLSDALVSAVENGTDAWKDFKDAGYDVLQQLGKKLMMELFFNKKFEALTKQLEDSYGTGDAEAIAEAQAAILQGFFTDIKGSMAGAEDFLKQWDEQMAAMGFSTEDTQNPLSGAIKGASEETVSILSGYANAIRIQQIESIQVMRNQLISLNKIETNTAKLTNILDVLTKMSESDSMRAYGL